MHKARCIITDEQQTVGILLMEHGEPKQVAAMLKYARLQMLAPPFMGRWNPAGLASFISYIVNYTGRGKVKIVAGPFPVTPDDEGMTIGEAAGSSIYLTASDDVDITLLYDEKERKTVEELTEDDVAVEFGWGTSRTMRPCSISRLNISSPVYAEAALYISDDGTVWSPPLNTDGQHRIWNEGYSAITKPLSEIWEDMSLPKTAAELEEIAPPEGEITVGWWWNHESPDEESS